MITIDNIHEGSHVNTIICSGPIAMASIFCRPIHILFEIIWTKKWICFSYILHLLSFSYNLYSPNTCKAIHKWSSYSSSNFEKISVSSRNTRINLSKYLLKMLFMKNKNIASAFIPVSNTNYKFIMTIPCSKDCFMNGVFINYDLITSLLIWSNKTFVESNKYLFLTVILFSCL